MPSDLISNIMKKLQDRFTILANYPIELIETKSMKHAMSLDHMPSDLISNIGKKLQDMFTKLASHPIELRRTNLNRP
jgi:hypothetical protein